MGASLGLVVGLLCASAQPLLHAGPERTVDLAAYELTSEEIAALSEVERELHQLTVRIMLENARISDILERCPGVLRNAQGKLTGMTFNVDAKALDDESTITIHAREGIPFLEFLMVVRDYSSLEYTIEGRSVTVRPATKAKPRPRWLTPNRAVTPRKPSSEREAQDSPNTRDDEIHHSRRHPDRR